MKKIKIYISESQNIFKNLALEEYFVTCCDEDILLFYINSDAVVIGKHQNPWKEVDLTNKNYRISRRLSGGGTVFHDLGNVNFSFIKNKTVDFVNFKEHIIPISKSLSALGIANIISPRNDIFVNDHKVSGNAEHVNSKLGRILHHGTLLYDSDLVRLNGSIRSKKEYNIETHAVNSVRSPVMNMREILDLGNTRDFLDKLIKKLHHTITISSVDTIDPSIIDEISALEANKYTSWEWNFGHTPQFSYTNNGGVTSKIRKGIVIESQQNLLIGKRFDELLND